ncbi:PepSY-associated TM helix domain-containing protein [Caulobacter soli]|uniref:PepSY-associated TM helix domain-containing protein n=1 Tax=Caulobacter soli TaxID=2708539 RepID=UPI0013EDB089|nr:PepSY-associated TM helix domain-containing protein [Caulobacter soli]
MDAATPPETRIEPANRPSIWPKVSPAFVRTVLSGHSGLGLVAAALIYIVCLSGTVAVFLNELKMWEEPAAPTMTTASPQAVQAFAEAITKAHPKAGFVYMGLPTPDMPRLYAMVGEQVFVADAQGRIAGEASAPWAGFLEHLHIYLHLPETIGLIVVGLVGAALTGLIVSGFLAHPKIFRDAFAFRWAGAKRLSQADLHNRLSVWGAPFHLVVAWTGAYIGLASVLLFAVAGVTTKGDIAKVTAPIYGVVPKADPTPAPFPDLVKALAWFDGKPQFEPTLISLTGLGTKGQLVEVNALMPKRLIYAERFTFDAQGRMTGKLGLSDDGLGKQVFASSYPLHFGSFGGLPVKIAYGLLGVALCVVTSSGVTIWLTRRRDRGRPAVRLEKAWAAVVWGSTTTLALSAALWLAFKTPPVWVFWAPLAVLVAAAVATRDARFWIVNLRIATSATLAATVAIHALKFGAPALGGVALGVNLTLLVLAAVIAPWRKPLTRETA